MRLNKSTYVHNKSPLRLNYDIKKAPKQSNLSTYKIHIQYKMQNHPRQWAVSHKKGGIQMKSHNLLNNLFCNFGISTAILFREQSNSSANCS